MLVTLVHTNGNWEWLLAPYSYNPIDTVGNTRFIDGDGDGRVAWNIGAYEFDS